VQTGSEHDVWLHALDDATSAPLLAGPGSEHSPRFSPDGRWLAFTSDEAGPGQVYVQALSGGERVQVSIDGGSGAVWRPDGTELFFIGGSGGASGVVTVPVTSDGTALRFGRPTELFATAERGPAGPSVLYEFSTNVGTGFDILPDGEGFVMVRLGSSRRHEIVLVQNWFAEVERLAPVAR
jgi:Tol biopolymer transport system component